MWIFTTDGFFSIVQKPDQQVNETPLKQTFIQKWNKMAGQKLTVRGRELQDIQRFIKRLKIHRDIKILNSPLADYEYRIIISKKEYLYYLKKCVMALTYDNFKNAAVKVDKQKSGRYHDVWSSMFTRNQSVDQAERRQTLKDHMYL